jgi:hypothetical protein
MQMNRTSDRYARNSKRPIDRGLERIGKLSSSDMISSDLVLNMREIAGLVSHNKVQSHGSICRASSAATTRRTAEFCPCLGPGMVWGRMTVLARSRSGDTRLGTSAVEVTPDVPFTASDRQPMTQTGHSYQAFRQREQLSGSPDKVKSSASWPGANLRGAPGRRRPHRWGARRRGGANHPYCVTSMLTWTFPERVPPPKGVRSIWTSNWSRPTNPGDGT